jgi:alpha,alpha-trehalose-phosphate synthase [UDP-forming]
LNLSLRFLAPLVAVLIALAYAVVPLVDGLTVRWFMRDLDIRAALVAQGLEEPVARAMGDGDGARIGALLDRMTRDERLYGLALCTPNGSLIMHSTTWPSELSCTLTQSLVTGTGQLRRLAQGPLHLATVPVSAGGEVVAQLLVVHDMSFVDRRTADTRGYVLMLFTVLGLVVALITVLVAHLSWRGWVAGVRALLRGEGVIKPFETPRPELQPLVGDLRALLRDVQAEQRLADDVTFQWTPETLRQLLHQQFTGDEVLVVSNREPYIHNERDSGIEVQRPASGLVTAVEPVMRACSGTWIAHGSGTADRQVVDRNDRLRVPPGEDAYTLRRVWLSPEEERGYYYGFANEGLWPLCHIAHVRPVFRSEDWEQYRRVNQRFADAVLREAATHDPVILVQDYHFALLPAMIRERLPRATIITFWHIPWPNPESFGICPWREEILRGLLGSTIVGFHTRYHCNNFLQTVDRFLETRIEYDTSTVHAAGHLTQIESYPISIAWPDVVPRAAGSRAQTRAAHGLPLQLVALGVDRLDYTKGIIERMRAVERLLELYPQWRGRFSLLQIAAPSRSALDEYQRFEHDVRALAARINERFGGKSYQPIILLVEHKSEEQVVAYYRAADICLVTSLHDGMNLVAKEFCAARDDEQGVLILSQFAGAARELHEALIVNPYHTDEVAETLSRALAMSPQEQRERMRSLRQMVREFNVYRWAARMLLDAARLRRRERVVAKLEEKRLAA